MTIATWIGVAGFGGTGAIARFVVDALVVSRMGREFPYGTLVVNLSGAIALGLLVGLAVHGNTYILLGTAALGAYTTFSTWMFETQRLHEDGELALGLANIVVSLALGLGVAALARSIGGHL